ncbi:MAG TPA: calcium/sodium antiporter [Burkholderiales bacterium]|nr:calcium/sodium antiporter [Burkholderiales bacterium]
MLIALALIIGGLLLLYAGAQALIKGAAALARRWGMSALAVGLTVVAGGTSAPELFVVTGAALEGRHGISLGNVLGANSLNIGLILGLTALVQPLRAQLQLIRFDVPIMILATLVVAAFIADGELDRLKGGVLVAFLAAYLAFTVFMARRERNERVREEFAGEVPGPLTSFAAELGLIVLGLMVLALGAQGLITGAVTVAGAWGVSDSVIGITVVAAGTTMPELITCVVAASRREGDIAIGNIVGSNIFNLLGVLGLAGVLAPISAAGVMPAEVWGAALLAALSLPVMWRGMIVNRAEGALLVATYLVYLTLVWRG